jgi:Fic family protein
MNKIQSNILDVLKNQVLGLSRQGIQSLLLIESVSSQQVQRALRALESQGLVRFEGNTKARRYWIKDERKLESVPFDSISFSNESLDVFAAVSKPVGSRTPSSYRRAFLDSYVPNETHYLDPSIRQRLLIQGQTNDVNQQAGTYARRVLERFMLDLSWNSARLEGNTYSLLDTEKLIQKSALAEGKSATEAQMLLNHKSAIEFLVAEPMTAGVDERTIKTLHALLLENLLGNRFDEGQLRSMPVHIGQSVYLPLANPQLIDECFRQIVLTAQRIQDPFECALFLLIQLPYLQPFIDGNKRTARLAANLPFVIHNLVPLSFVDVPIDVLQKSYLAVYELNDVGPMRDLFVWAYQRSVARLGQVRSSLGEPDLFRLEHRQTLRKVVTEMVHARIPLAERRTFLLRFSESNLAPKDQSHFVAMAELEIEGLNEHTYARYGLRPSEFEEWKNL